MSRPATDEAARDRIAGAGADLLTALSGLSHLAGELREQSADVGLSPGLRDGLIALIGEVDRQGGEFVMLAERLADDFTRSDRPKK